MWIVLVLVFILLAYWFSYEGFGNLKPGDLWRVNNYRNLVNAKESYLIDTGGENMNDVRINGYWSIDERDRLRGSGYTPYDVILRDQLYREAGNGGIYCGCDGCSGGSDRHMTGNNYMQDHLLAGIKF